MLDENLFVESTAAVDLMGEYLWIVAAVAIVASLLSLLVPAATIKLSLAAVGRSITLRRAMAVATVSSMLTISFSIGQFVLMGQSHAWLSFPLMLLAMVLAITGIGRCEPTRAVMAAVVSFVFMAMAGVGLAMVLAVGVWWFGASDLTAGGQDLLAGSAAGFGPMLDMEALLDSDESSEAIGAEDVASGMLSGVGKMAGLAASSGMMDDVDLGTLVSVGQEVAMGADLQGGSIAGLAGLGTDLTNASSGQNGGNGIADFSQIAGDLTAGAGGGTGGGLQGSLGDLSGAVGDVTAMGGTATSGPGTSGLLGDSEPARAVEARED